MPGACFYPLIMAASWTAVNNGLTDYAILEASLAISVVQTLLQQLEAVCFSPQ